MKKQVILKQYCQKKKKMYNLVKNYEKFILLIRKLYL